MAKVYVIIEGNGYDGGDYDDMNCDYNWFVCVYPSEELAKEHLKKWKEDKLKMLWLRSDEFKWTVEDKKIQVDNLHEDDCVSWYYCKYKETEILQKVRLE